MATVLIVEDNDDNRDMLSRRLERQGFTIISAPDGVQGVIAAQNQLPDIILMDMSLPLLDGWEATRMLKGDEKTKSIPIIALTAHAMSDDRERAMKAGCDDYDTKPVNLTRLIVKIKVLLDSVAPATS